MNIGESAYTILRSHIYLPQLEIWVYYWSQKSCNKVRLLLGKICHLQSSGHTAPKWSLLNMTTSESGLRVCLCIYLCLFEYIYNRDCISSIPSNEFPTGWILWCVDAASFDKMFKDRNRLLLMNLISKKPKPCLSERAASMKKDMYSFMISETKMQSDWYTL